MNNLIIKPFLIFSMLSIMSGCASMNEKKAYQLDKVNTEDGYYLSNAKTNNSESLLVVLSFSGGGTRAASLAYGVLEKLKETEISIDGKTSSLLNEIDIISSVSGGSYTAGYYGLHGKKIFEDFEEEFLKRNYERELYAQLLFPWNWFRLARSDFDRSDLAAEYANYLYFDDASIADMNRPDSPFIMINASEIGHATQMSFEQRQFDMFCIDLKKVPLASAVQASSSVPIAFSPIVFENLSDHCDNKLPRWAKNAIDEKKESRSLNLARTYQNFFDTEEYPFLHFYDGVLTDNLGLRSFLNVTERQGGAWNSLKVLKHPDATKIVVIVVDAKSSAAKHIAKKRQLSLGDAISTSVSLSVDSLSYETFNVLREDLNGWQQQIILDRCWEYAGLGKDQETCFDFQEYVIEVSLGADNLTLKEQKLDQLPTSFNLKSKQVDQLTAVAHELLAESPVFQDLLNDLQSDADKLSARSAAIKTAEPALENSNSDSIEPKTVINTAIKVLESNHQEPKIQVPAVFKNQGPIL